MDLSIFRSFPEFEFGEYRLRQINNNDDSENYFFYMNNQNVLSFLNSSTKIKSVDHARIDLYYWENLFHEKRGFYWAICLKSDNSLIGTAGYNTLLLQNRRAELSYDLDYEYWGKGIMTRTLKYILQFSIENLFLKRIQATTLKNNQRSISLLEKLKFQREGILRNYETLDGVNFLDSYIYSRIN